MIRKWSTFSIVILFLLVSFCGTYSTHAQGSKTLTRADVESEKQEAKVRIDRMIESSKRQIKNAVKAGKSQKEIQNLKSTLHNMIEDLRKQETERISKLESQLLRIELGSSADSSSATSVNRKVADKWALVVGVSQFKNPKLNLKYAAKDAKEFARFLIEHENFAEDHVLLLTDEKATRRNILGAIGARWLPRLARKDDVVVIFFSTHGSPSDFDVGGVNYLVAHDTEVNNLYGTGIPMQDLTRMIKGRVHSDRIVILLDACHSGATSAEGKGVMRTGNIDIESLVSGTGQLVISSSLPSQRSWESKRSENGVFTRHIIDALRVKGTATTLGEAFSTLKQRVEDETLRDRAVLQTPVMKSKWKGDDLRLSILPSDPRKGLQNPFGVPQKEDARTAQPAQTSQSTTQTKPTQQLETSDEQRKKTGSIVVLDFVGPIGKAEAAWKKAFTGKVESINHELGYMTANSLRLAIQNRGLRVLSGIDVKAALNRNGISLTDKSTSADYLKAARVLNAKYIIRGTIYDAIFKERFWTGNDYILTSSASVYSGVDGKLVLKTAKLRVKKWPWAVGEQHGYKVFWQKYVLPEMGQSLADSIFKAGKN